MSARIASLIASSTEIVCALGLEERLVARSHECDFPPSIKALPAVTLARLDPEASSAEIDRRVREVLKGALSVYEVDAAKLKSLAPDLVITQTQCEVCAVSLADVEKALCQWLGSAPRVVALAPDGLDDVWADVLRVAEACGVPERGTALVASLRGRLDALAARVAGSSTSSPSGRSARPRVALVEWIEPLMVAGNWTPSLCRLAGGEPVLSVDGQHAPYVRWPDLVAADPEVIVVHPCGFDLERTRREAPALLRLDGWSDLRAVKDGRVALMDGNALINRPGPRLVESAEVLAEVIHPDVSFGHRGRWWEPFPGG